MDSREKELKEDSSVGEVETAMEERDSLLTAMEESDRILRNWITKQHEKKDLTQDPVRREVLNKRIAKLEDKLQPSGMPSKG